MREAGHGKVTKGAAAVSTRRINIPAGHLKSILMEKISPDKLSNYQSTSELEKLALEYFTRDELLAKAEVFREKTRVKENALKGNLQRPDTISQDRQSTARSIDDSSDFTFYDRSSLSNQGCIRRSYTDCSAVDFGGGGPGIEPFPQCSTDLDDLDSYHHRQIGSADNTSCREYGGGGCSSILRGRSSLPHIITPLNETGATPCQRMSHGGVGSGTAGRWNQVTPMKSQQPTPAKMAYAETPLIQPSSHHLNPSYYHHSAQNSEHMSKSYISRKQLNRMYHQNDENTVPYRILEEDDNYGATAAAANPTFKTPLSHPKGIVENLASCFRSRKSSPAAATNVTAQITCRPRDPVRCNPVPWGARPVSMPQVQTRRKATNIGAWILIAVGTAILLRCIVSFSWSSRLFPIIKFERNNPPEFCSLRRGSAPGSTCVPCPAKAVCFEGKAECPTFYALEKRQGWECVSYKMELERTAEDGLHRIAAYLRKIETPVHCTDTTTPLSAVSSRRDVMDLFDKIMLPMLDERQKGLKDGLLQMYLTLIMDDEKLRNLHLEKQGTLHVMLASVMSRNRWACVLKRLPLIPMGVSAVLVGFLIERLH